MVVKGLITPQQALETLKSQPPTPPKAKYNNKLTVVDGITFHSQKEAKRYGELLILEKAGIISNLTLQPKFVLYDSFRCNDGTLIKPITYVADFQYTENEPLREVVEDVKGMETKEFLLKKKLFLKRYPQYKFILT
jgi:hypothetical protein